MKTIGKAAGVLAIVSAVSAAGSIPAVAQEAKKSLSPELQRVRQVLDKYKDPVVAVHDGYWSTLGCVTYPKAGGPGEVPYQAGGMGVHFVNFALIGQPLDPMKPQILVYQPVKGKLQLVAAEWLVPLSPDVKGPPALFGRKFDGPMEGHEPLMPKQLQHYDLHVWLWKDNPSGVFAPTNPKLSCPKGLYTLEETAPRLIAK